MAKPIIVDYGGVESSFALTRLDREKLYGRKQRQTIGPDGKRCLRAELTRDGQLLVRSGMTAQAYFDAGNNWVPNGEMVGIDPDGNTVDKQNSTLGVAQTLEGPVEADAVLDMTLRTIYLLAAQELDPKLKDDLSAGKIFRFAFNYRADYALENAFLVGNEHGLFALIGNASDSSWCELEAAAVPTFDDGDDDDDLDFEMF